MNTTDDPWAWVDDVIRADIDRITAELILEEHRQGMPFGKPGHCQPCDRTHHQQAVAALQAACPHDGGVIELTAFAQLRGTQLCGLCGKTLQEALP